MKKNAMSQIAVGVLSTCLAGAALANGGPGDLCNSGNIKRSEIVQTTNANKYQKDWYGKLKAFNFTRRIQNTTGVNCVVQFNGGEVWFKKNGIHAGYTAENAGSSKIMLRAGAVTDVFANNTNDITYQRAYTTPTAPLGLTFDGVMSGRDY